MSTIRNILTCLGVAAAICATPAAKGDFTFGEPVNLKTVIPVIDPAHDAIDCISYDGLELYIDSNRSGGGPQDWDLWVLRRASKDEDWGPPENLGPAVNDPNVSALASISADGLTLYFNSDRPGGYGSWDIYMTTRATKNDLWGLPVNVGPKVNSSANDGAPWISADGLELYFHSWRSGGYGRGDIYVTRRATTDDPWGEPVNLGLVANSAYPDVAPSVSPDGLVLFLSDNETTPFRPGGYGGADMWMIRRTTISDPWQAPVNLGPKLNSSAHDGMSRISPDGRMLYFWTFAGSDPSGWNNWQAPVVPVVDFTGDGKVDRREILVMIDCWDQSEPLCDIGPTPMGDGIVDTKDLAVLAEYMGNDVNDPTLIAHWALDETDGATAHDSAGANDATVMGNAVWQPDGKVDGALGFDGADDLLRTSLVVLDPSKGPFSVIAWVKGGEPGQVVISQQKAANWLMADASQGFLMTELKSGGRFAGALRSQAVITDGNWHRVGLVWDGSNRTLYVDGLQVARDTDTNLLGADTVLHIGAGKGLSPGTFWSGLIDDVRIYNRVVRP